MFFLAVAHAILSSPRTPYLKNLASKLLTQGIIGQGHLSKNIKNFGLFNKNINVSTEAI